MFSDTHFHFPHCLESNPLFNPTELLKFFIQNKTFFAQDIGTRSSDIYSRVEFFEKAISSLSEEEKSEIKKMFWFTIGIWPDVEAIKDRYNQIKTLEKSITDFLNSGKYNFGAVGECGIDHHWNPSGVDGRCQNDFSDSIYQGERELFVMQIKLAKKINRPVIVHSRDGFEDTLECIKEAGYHKGIIHCYSYGLEEAKQFLDLGWYISLSGSITYTKKSKMEDMKQLINYIPKDRILLETDAPYLAPVPKRGTVNTPSNVVHTYEFASEIMNMPVAELCNIVDQNCRNLFL